MNTTIRAAINEISRRIAQCQDLIKSLQQFEQMYPDLPAVPAAPEPEKPHTQATKATKRKPVQRNGNGHINPRTLRTLAVFDNLPEEFTHSEVIAAGGKGNRIFNLKRVGLVERASPGKWRRTSLWPASGAPAPAATADPAAASPSMESVKSAVNPKQKSVARQIEELCAKRDRHRSKPGEENLAEVYQREIDKLSKHL